MTPEIEIKYDRLIFEGVTIPRPSRMSVSQWFDYWKNIFDSKDEFEAGYQEGHRDGKEDGHNSSYEDGYEQGYKRAEEESERHLNAPHK